VFEVHGHTGGAALNRGTSRVQVAFVVCSIPCPAGLRRTGTSVGGTGDTISVVFLVTGTCERTDCIGTGGVGVTVISSDFAFVDFAAFDTISEETTLALTRECSDVINTVSIWRADIVTGKTLVDIVADMSIALESSDAVTEETFVSVNTGGIDIAGMGSISTLIYNYHNYHNY
jgi:hypothetical protein